MKYTERFTSCTNTHVNYDLYLPFVMIRQKAVIQIHHGMFEHSGRYERFAEFLTNEGYIVVVSDFPGHGRSLHNFEKGYLGRGKATETLVEDMHRLRGIISKRYPDLPYFILGNQLGSYVLRQYVSRFGDFIQGAILMGTTDKIERSLFKRARLLLHSVFRNKLHKSRTLHSSWRKGRNAFFTAEHTRLPYLTSDVREQERYVNDPLTDVMYTNKNYREIFSMIKEVSKVKNIEHTPNYLSIYIISGVQDVFGRMGKGPKRVYEIYQKRGIRDLELTLYEKCRHDILHEKNKDKVYQDILRWLEERTYI